MKLKVFCDTLFLTVAQLTKSSLILVFWLVIAALLMDLNVQDVHIHILIMYVCILLNMPSINKGIGKINIQNTDHLISLL